MENKLEGKKLADVTFKVRVQNDAGEFEWKDVNTDELFSGKRVVMFSLPGAFTPTCSSTHLPGYEAKYDDIKGEGIDEIYCLSVNDTFVMNAWAKNLGVSKVKLVPDGSALLTRDLGMLVKKDNLGFGERSWRYSMVVKDGEVEKAFVEPGFEDNCATDPFEVSDADTMLEYLKENKG